jgi:hypothetical protein
MGGNMDIASTKRGTTILPGNLILDTAYPAMDAMMVTETEDIEAIMKLFRKYCPK